MKTARTRIPLRNLIGVGALLFALAAIPSGILTSIAVQKNQADWFCVVPDKPSPFTVTVQSVECLLVFSAVFEQFTIFFLMIGVPLMAPIALFLVYRLVRATFAKLAPWRRQA